MKLLIILIAWVCSVSLSCVKVKHLVPSHAEYINVTISNATTQQTNQVHRNESYRFHIDNFSSLSLEQEDFVSRGISYNDIFPLADNTDCKGFNASSARGGGGCTVGGCCKVSLSLYSIIDGDDVSIMMKARVNIINAQGNHEFWICQKELMEPATTSTEEPPTSTEEHFPLVQGGWAPLTTAGTTTGCVHDGLSYPNGFVKAGNIDYPGPNCWVWTCNGNKWTHQTTNCVYCEKEGIMFAPYSSVSSERDCDDEQCICSEDICVPPMDLSGAGVWQTIGKTCGPQPDDP